MSLMRLPTMMELISDYGVQQYDRHFHSCGKRTLYYIPTSKATETGFLACLVCDCERREL